MRDFKNWNGQAFKKAILKGEFPEYNYLILPDGTHVPHDSVWHTESIFDHVVRVVDEASKLSKRYKLNEEEHNILMVSSTFHDCGKIFTRKEKERLQCTKCGKVYPPSWVGPCKGCGCYKLEMRTFHGYHNHELVGVSDWLFGNIVKREQIPLNISTEAKDLIAHHLEVAKYIEYGDYNYPFTKLNLLLSWADEKGRDSAYFIPDYSETFNDLLKEIIQGEKNE